MSISETSRPLLLASDEFYNDVVVSLGRVVVFVFVLSSNSL